MISANEPGVAYQLASSLTAGAIPVDYRSVGLGLDVVASISISGLVPSVFEGYAGTLDAQGKASAKLRLPVIPQLVGQQVLTAFVTLDATVRSGVRTISNTCSVRITP